MRDQRQQRRADHDARRVQADRAQHAGDDRIEQAGVGHHAEEQDREDEHRRDRRGLLDAGDREGAGLEAEPAEQRRQRRQRDQRDQRRHPPAHDRGEHRDDRQQAEQRQGHGPGVSGTPASSRAGRLL